jgi:hypothetical protein
MLSAFTTKLNAQHTLIKDSLLVINGTQYGYSINNVQSKDDYERYEIRFFIKNTGCTKYTLTRNSNVMGFGNSGENAVATFNCINATGKRLTNKNTSLNANVWYLTITKNMSKELAGKVIQVGYIFRSGETITGSEILITPKGEFPNIEVSPTMNREMN